MAVDKDGPYILEGAHRAAALHMLGAKSFPAQVVLDKESLGQPATPKLSKAEILQKGRKPMAVGTITERGGKKFKKEASGEWVPVKSTESSVSEGQASKRPGDEAFESGNPQSKHDQEPAAAQTSRATPTFASNDELNAAAANMSAEEYIKQSIKVNNYRDSPKNRKILKDRHRRATLIALDGGAELSSEARKSVGDLPKQLQTHAQQQTNLFYSVDLSKVPQKRHEQMFKLLNGANSVIESMGVRFKRSLRFEAGNSLRAGDDRSTHATYVGGGGVDRRVVLKDMSHAETSVMHEIGHALDYAMASGDNEHSTRSSQMLEDKTELGQKYRDLEALVVNTDRYLSADSGHKTYLNKPTEVFARAFEVYSLGKAQALIANGKLDKSFIDGYLPDIFKDRTAYRKKSSEYSEISRSLKQFVDKQEGTDYSAKYAIAAEKPEFKQLSERLDEVSKGMVTMRTGIDDRLSPEKQKEYISKITDIMDFILKNDSLKKSSEFEQIPKAEDYRGQHSAPTADGGAPMHDLGGTYPDDIYGPHGAQHYGHGVPYDHDAISALRNVKGKPKAGVKIYRAVPHTKSNSEKIQQLTNHKAQIQRRGKMPSDAWKKPGGGNWANTSEYYDFAYNTINDLKDKPEPETNKPITLNRGDWVTTTRQYAKEHGESVHGPGNYKIMTKVVPAKHVFTDGNSIHEYGYDPGEPVAKIPRPLKKAVAAHSMPPDDEITINAHPHDISFYSSFGHLRN